MTALIYLISLAGAALTIFSPAPFWQLCGAVGWLCIVPVWATALEKHRVRVRIRRIYRAAMSMTRAGECVNDLTLDGCVCASPEECGACWVSMLGQDPEAFREWLRGQEGC